MTRWRAGKVGHGTAREEGRKGRGEDITEEGVFSESKEKEKPDQNKILSHGALY